jgi:hypothetical protein
MVLDVTAVPNFCLTVIACSSIALCGYSELHRTSQLGVEIERTRQTRRPKCFDAAGKWRQWPPMLRRIQLAGMDLYLIAQDGTHVNGWG